MEPDPHPAPSAPGVVPEDLRATTDTGSASNGGRSDRNPVHPDAPPAGRAPLTAARAMDALSRLRLASRALNQSPPVAEALEVLVRQALAPLPISGAVIGLVRPNRTLQIVGTLGMGEDVRSRYLALGLDDHVPLTDAASRGVPVWLHDLAELDRRYPHLLGQPDRAEASASLPLMVDERCVGALGIACDEPSAFSADERILLLTVADLCAAYLDRIGLVRVEARARLRRRSTDVPNDVAPVLSAPETAGVLPDGTVATGRRPGAGRSRADDTDDAGAPTGHDAHGARDADADADAEAGATGVATDDEAGTGRDVQLLASFIANSPVALGLFDRDQRFVMLNDKLAELSGLPATDHIGRHVSEILPGLASQSERLMERVLRTASAIEDVELSGPTLARPEGADWRVNYYPVHDVGGHLFGVGVTVTDVTATNRRERLLQEAFTERDHIARVLQQSLLPVQPPQLPGLSIATLYLPAGEGNAVGGDFYDVFPTDGAFHIVVGDVCGQGAEAAALTGFARDTLRATAGVEQDPVAALRRLNDLLLVRSSGDRFITVAHLVVDRGPDRTVTVALAGHPHPLLVRGGDVRALGSPGSLLGVHKRVHVEARRAKLRPGDLLLAYTDGLTDQSHAPMKDDELRDLVRSVGHLPVDDVVATIRAHLRDRRSGTTADDTLLLAVRVEPL